MKVLFVLPRFHTNLFFATKALVQAGIGVHLFCASQDKAEDHTFVRPVIFPATSLDRQEVSRQLRAINPDIVVIRQSGRLSDVVFWLSLMQRRPMLGYDQRPYLRPRSFRGRLRGFLRAQPMFRMTPVHGLHSPIARGDRHAAYLPFPVENTASGSPRDYLPGGTARILCVGKLAQPRKNHLMLLEALEQLAPEFAFSLTLAGSTSVGIKGGSREYFDEVMARTNSAPLAGRVSVRGDVPFPEMAALYAAHDICVLPSRAEPLGTAPLEAMGNGCATIISSDSGSANYVQGAELAGIPCGAIFNTGDGEDLTATLRRILERPDTIPAMGMNAAQWTRQEFAPEAFVDRFLQLMQSRYGLRANAQNAPPR